MASQQHGVPGWTRRDVSRVPPLGAYAARHCPARTQFDILRPTGPLPPRDSLQARWTAGVDHEGDVTDELADAHGLVPTEVPADPEAREAWTAAAMAEGAPLIVGGRLPRDDRGRRVGEPDLLVREGDAPVGGRWRYRAADVKHHLVLGDALPAVVRQLGDPALGPAPDPTALPRVGRRKQADLLQLAHYQRMLEACGHGGAGPAWGGIVGSEGVLAWFPLDHPVWRTPARSEGRRVRERTTMEVYDFEFGFRLDIAAAAIEHREPSTSGAPPPDLLVVPILCSECPDCPWRGHCLPWLEGRRDVSLLPGLAVRDVLVHRAAGITTVDDLAALDPQRDRGRYARPPRHLGTLVDLARAWAGPDVAYRRRHVDEVVVPRADLEVDVDLEQAPDGTVILWGALVSDRRTGAPPELHQDVCWDPAPSVAAEVRLFAGFWSWLTGVRRRAAVEGATVTVQCWNAATEARALRRLGQAAGVGDEVEALLSGDEWVDLMKVVDRQVVTGRGIGLKEVAMLTGFRWRHADASGMAALSWWADAVGDDPAVAAGARARLLDYNADDVRATAAVRDWLATTPLRSVAE